MPLSVLSFFLGVLCLQYGSFLPNAWLLACALLFCGIALYYRFKRPAYFIMGFLWASSVALYTLDNRLIPELQAQEVLIEGAIIGVPQSNKRRVRFDFKVKPSAVTLPNKIRLSWYYPKQAIKAGQEWHFWVKLKAPHGTLNPAGFDYEKWLFSQNIGATGYVRKPHLAQLMAEKTGWQSISVLREKFFYLLEQSVISRDSLAIIKALTLGDKSDLSVEQWRVMSYSGTSHLIAISGLHIGLIAVLVYGIVLRLYLYFPVSLYAAPQVAASVSLIAAIFYAALAGFSIPTQRALIMLSLLMLGWIFKRRFQPIKVLAIALLLMLCLEPLSALSLSFYLSFSAVFFILYVFSARLAKDKAMTGFVKLHLLMGVALLPLVLLFFQKGSLIAPVANMVAVPVVSFILLPVALLGVLLLPLLPSVAQLLLICADTVIQYLWIFLSYLTQYSWVSFNMAQPSLGAVFLALLGLLLFLAPKGLPAKYLGVLMFLPLFFPVIEKPKQGELRLTVLDVGQGLSVVVETAEHVLVFDTGAKFSESMDMGKNVLLPFLRSRSIRQVDSLVISHADNDHSGGAKALLQQLPVTNILSSAPNVLPEYSVDLCSAGFSWQWDGVIFTFLSPPQEIEFRGKNNNACVLKIMTAYGSILVPADVEQEAEQWLVKTQPIHLQADLLIAPHHGSKTSSTLAFLQAVNPKWIVIPADAPNRFSFPHQSVIKRYQAIGVEYFVTGKTGAFTVKFKASGVEMESYRARYGKYWNQLP